MRNTMLVSTAAVLVACGAASGVTHSNGPFVTGVGNGFGGANTSSIDPTHTTFGVGTNEAATPASGGPIRVADDFTVSGGGWDISSATFYLYQTVTTPATNPIVNTINSIRVGVYTSMPNGTALPDFGDFSTNRLTGAVFSGTFRVTSTTLTNDDRAIFALTVDMSWLPNLSDGTYWLAWSTTGTNASGPWHVPVTPALPGHNARQMLDNNLTGNPSWAQIDGSTTAAGIQPLDLAFDLEYTAVPAPGAAALLGVAGLVGFRRKRA